MCFFPAIFLATTPLSLRYHCITIQYFPRTMLPILHLQRSNLPTTGAQRRSTAKRTTTCHPPPVWCSASTRRVNILLLPRLVVECSIFSLSITPESYSGISVMVLPLSVHAEYPCVPLSNLA